MTGTPSPQNVSTRLQQIAELAKKAPEAVLTTLAHHIDVDFLREAHRRTRKDAAPGVDGVVAAEYAVNLDENLKNLLNRFKSGTYQAPPVKRVYIPKGDGKSTRPIGIPTFEDKVLQRAVVMVLEQVYEQDFLNCSYGSRPRRSAHQALNALRAPLMASRGGMVIDLDVSKFFDTLKLPILRSFLDLRVKDGVLRKTIDKWLKAGVLESGTLSYPDDGTPQGGVVSPLLANIYLHEVLDKWFEGTVKPRLKGSATLIRYVDDAVIVLTDAGDALRVMEVLPKRFARFGLTIHPEKTKLVPFRHPWKSDDDGPGTFNFLGFTHYWGKTGKGGWAVMVKTAKDRFKRALRRVSEWCEKHRHLPMGEQRTKLGRKITGHCQYYGRTGNSVALQTFKHKVERTWFTWLQRRDQRARMTWAQFWHLLQHVHPLPEALCVRSILRPAVNP